MTEYKYAFVYVKALDHASFNDWDRIDDELRENDFIEIVGEIIHEDDNYYYIRCFQHVGGETASRMSGMKILKRCIVKIKILKYREEL